MSEEEELLRYLITLWTNEILNEELQKIDTKRLEKLLYVLRNAEKNLQGDKSDMSYEILKKELNILNFIIHDLGKIRCEKLISKLLSGEQIEMERLLPHERKILNTLYILLTEPKIHPTELSVPEEDLSLLCEDTININKSDINYIVVHARNDIGPFVGIDGYIYRGISSGDAVSLPKENFRAFKKIKLRILFGKQ